jgi:hypothetical protein
MVQVRIPARPLTEQRIKLCKEWGYVAKPAVFHFQTQNVNTDALQSRHGTRREEVIKQYMEAIRGGAEFPLPGITEDAVVVWGKATVDAMRRLGYKEIPALVLVDVSYINGNQAVQDELHMLDLITNVQNGERPSEEDIRSGIATGVRRGFFNRKIAQDLAIPLKTVNREVFQLNAEARMERQGIGVSDRLSVAQKRMLGSLSSVTNDRPFQELAKLSADAGLRTAEIRKLSNRAKAEKSDESAVRVIKAEREALASRIQKLSNTGFYHKHVRTPPEMMWPVMAHIANQADKVDEFWHHEPVGRAEFALEWNKALTTSIEVLTKLQASLMREAELHAS